MSDPRGVMVIVTVVVHQLNPFNLFAECNKCIVSQTEQRQVRPVYKNSSDRATKETASRYHLDDGE